MTEHSLYTLSALDDSVDVQRPKDMLVRLTDGEQLDRSIARVTVGEHGGVTIAVREGVVVTSLDLSELSDD
jgi:hypothetical protein